MAQRSRAAMDVYFLVRNAKVAHREHGDAGKGFVDFEQVNIGDVPTCLGLAFGNCAYRGGGEILWRLRVRGMCDNARDRRLATRSSG